MDDEKYSHSRTLTKLRVVLNNKKVKVEDMERFLGHWGLSVPYIILSDKKPKKRLGMASVHQQRVVLYRHSVLVCLHEIAHIFTGEHGHHDRFIHNLDRLIYLWTIYKGVSFRTGKKLSNGRLW
jgi:hypothetical protein